MATSLKEIKVSLYHLCQDYLAKRIANAQQAIAAAQEAANNETKSSSGDKYETGRAMMQLEIEKDSAQLSESLKLKYALDQIKLESAGATVQTGSLVSTDVATFFIAISVGKLVLDDKTYLAISPASPMGRKLMGLKVSDSLSLNGNTHRILEIN
jgi:transcription elongation GreA/GreB family factor